MFGGIAARLIEGLANSLARAAEGLASKLPAGFPRSVASTFEGITVKVVAIVVVVFQFLGRDLYDAIVTGVLRLVARAFVDDPRQIEATVKLGAQIGNEISTNTALIGSTFASCLIVVALFLGLPLLRRLIFRRNLRIFISFNRVRSDIAEQLHAFLEKCSFRVSRIPFNPAAEHQTTLQKIVEYLKQSELVVCVPGPSNSFVEHEILAANAIGHPVVLLISEKDGTIPDTADKRYPAFQMEDVAAQAFQPLEAFIRFIGGDLRSLWGMSLRALRQGVVLRLSQGIVLGLVASLLGLWAMCFVIVVNAPSAGAARTTSPLEAHLAIGTNIGVMALCASLVALCLVYCLRVVYIQLKQRSAQRRAQLKVKAGEFRRDDWLDLMTGLSAGNMIYSAMFETAPLAHHERLRPAKPA
jgi:hypothetical protein